MRPDTLTPAMQELLCLIRRGARQPFHQLTPVQSRRTYASVAEALDLPRQALARVEALQVPARDGALLPARLYAPSQERLPAMLYLHGGGFTIGDLDTHDSLCRQLAWRAGIAVLALAYRLAPEHRFPVAVDDAWDALQWLAQQSGRLGLDGARLAVGGDSAGGTLAAVTALQARDADLPLALQVLITPGTASDMASGSHQRFGQGYLLERADIEWFFDQYVDADARRDWRFAPLQADSLDGVAPAHVCVAECDPLADEGVAYADRLRLAGVPTQLELWRGVTHDFIKLGRAIPEARAAQAAIAQALRAVLFHA
ncbi:MAG TPA: alpha/beta hydrolase [Burkholderiaceae bacterium]|nr:alpha/beta hydrolase [Burkholderiaceae bacterium]